ncbi:MAG: hypothetical protein JWM88_574 [Verrucomicrobia bacterium]|nr:hypothetical protein [Verrucomicrobiota bacterium]
MQFIATAAQKRRVSSVSRLAAALLLTLGGVVASARSTVSVRRDLETIVTMAPAPVMVAKGQELVAAEAAAKRIEGAQAFLGAGESMEPLYVSGTAIVVTACDYSQLRAGMSVVYVNHNGRGVAHVLVNEMPGGWIAQGVNNAKEDGDLVTRANLVGVITQAYASAETPLRREIASRAVLKLVKATSQLALNLPRSGAAGMASVYSEGTN